MKINKKYSFFQQLNISKKGKHSVLSSLKPLLREGVLISEMPGISLASPLVDVKDLPPHIAELFNSTRS